MFPLCCHSNPPPQLLGQNYCLSESALEDFETSTPIQVTPEVIPNPQNCTQTIRIPQGKKHALFYFREEYYEDPLVTALCLAYLAGTGDPTTCQSSVQITASANQMPSFQVASYSSLSGLPAGDWSFDGTLWTRYVLKVLDVAECAAQADCELNVRVVTTRSDIQNLQGFQFIANGTFTFDIENTPWLYLPEDASDGEGSMLPSREIPSSSKSKSPPRRNSTCSDCPDGKSVSYFAGVYAHPSVNPDQLLSKITFDLSLPSGVSGYQPGSSSNFGTQTAADPDYQFETSKNPGFEAPTANGQTIRTADEVPFAMVTVSSFDYGGVAILRAKTIVGGDVIFAQSTPAYNLEGYIFAPPGCAVDPSDKRGFVQIPIDTDCNWIADSWEWDKAMPKLNTRHFPRYWDGEATSNARPEIVKGDGYGAFDEYRGFHVVDTAGSHIHVRTDPAKLTAFFHEKIQEGSNNQTKEIVAAVRRLLVPTLAQEVEFWELAKEQFNDLKNGRSGSLNINSLVSDSQLKNYPLVFSVDSNAQTCVEGSYGSTAKLGKDNTDIIICLNKVTSDAASSTIPLQTALAFVVAHEVGHRFKLRHYSRLLEYHSNRLGQAEAIAELGNTNTKTYIESSDPNSNGKDFFAVVRYGRTGFDGFFNDFPVEDFDYRKYDDPSENSALSGLSEDREPNSPPEVSLVHPANPPPVERSENVKLGVFRFHRKEPLSSVGPPKYKSPARLQVYERNGIMTFRLIWQIAEKDAIKYGFIPSSLSDQPNDTSMIQLND